jgi:predicted ATPase
MADGDTLLKSGLADFKETGARIWKPFFLWLLSEASEASGKFDEAAAQLEGALQNIEATGERWFEAEVNRQKGRLLVKRGDIRTAEELYRQALRIAEGQHEKLWQLRAAVGLARLWCEQGRREETRELLGRCTAGSPKDLTRRI